MAATATFDLADALEKRRLGGFDYRLIALSSLATFFDAFDIAVTSFLTSTLSERFELTRPMLGDLFGIGFLGMFFGNFLFGYLGDRFGRRPAIILAVGLFSLLTFCLALSTTYWQLMLFRFLDGIALGGALPLIWTLNSEYAPKRLRASIITIINIGFGLGAACAGPMVRLVLPHFDWQGVYVVGGLLSLFVTMLLFAALPESPRFLANKDRTSEVGRILARLGVKAPMDGSVRYVMPDEREREERRVRIKRLFEGKLKWITPLLWLSYFGSSLAGHFNTSWGPYILENLGFSPDHAAYLTTANSLAGMLGGLLLMRFTDRHGPISVSVLALMVVPLLLFAGLAPITLSGFLMLVIPISFFLGGTHFGVTSVISGFYPSAIRASGTGWCSGIAKIGSIIGPVVGGYVLASSLPVRMTFAILAIPPFIVGLALLSIGLIERRTRSLPPPAPEQQPSPA